MATHADISGNLTMGALQSVRRNAANTTFEPYTSAGANTYIFNVRDYGATGDGATDDTTAIQATITAAEAENGIVFFPYGDYLVSGSGTELLLIQAQIQLIGSGWGSQIVVAATVGASTDVIRVYGPSEGLRIADIKIVPASGTPAQHGINLDATSTYEGERPISKFVIEHVWIAQLGGRGIKTTFPAPYLNGIFNGVIRECFIYGGIHLDRAGDTIAIRDNSLAGTGPGIEANIVDGAIAASQLLIDHNSIVSADGSIVVVAGQRIHITNNNLEPSAGSTPGTNDALIDLQGVLLYPLEGINIQNNLFSCTPNTATYHIRADYVRGLNVLGNTFGYGLAGQRAVRTTANCADVWVGPNCHLAYYTGLDYMFSTLGADVMTYLARFGTHRIGPAVDVRNDTQAEENTAFVVTASTTQATDLILVRNEAGDPFFRIGATGSIMLSANRQINATDSAGALRPVFDSPSIDDTVRIGFIDTAPPTNGHLRFYSAGTERARILPNGQVVIGGYTPVVGALLTVESYTMGFAPPCMTTLQRDAISTPGVGLMVYNTTTGKLNVFTGAHWEEITSVQPGGNVYIESGGVLSSLSAKGVSVVV